MKEGKILPPVILSIDKVRESITPKQTNKTPTVGVPGIPGMPGGAVVPPMGGEFAAGAPAAGAGFDPTATDDLPF